MLQDGFPSYFLRKSNKARYLQLRITSGQLEVIIPKRMDWQAGLDYLQKNQKWVLAHQHLIHRPIDSLMQKPEEVYLRAISRHWKIEYQSLNSHQRIQEQKNKIILYLREFSILAIVNLLKRWLKRKAQSEISPRLNQLSLVTGLVYQAITYRGQQRRWGSCSLDGHICLNYKLLFLPSEYVDYVLIHELCHTKHFNHSCDFWNLLKCFIPDWQIKRRQVRCADEFLPFWIK